VVVEELLDALQDGLRLQPGVVVAVKHIVNGADGILVDVNHVRNGINIEVVHIHMQLLLALVVLVEMVVLEEDIII
jgi:precorrin isomerase